MKTYDIVYDIIYDIIFHIVYDVVGAYDIVYDMQYKIVFDGIYDVVSYAMNTNQFILVAVLQQPSDGASRFQLPCACTLQHGTAASLEHLSP